MSTLLAACLLLTVAAVWLGVLGAARLRDPLDRLHAVTFVNIAGGAAVTAAAFVTDGVSGRSLKITLMVLLSWAIGAALAHATDRALLRRDHKGAETG